MKSPGGEAGFSVLLTQDIAVIPILALLPLLAIPELADLAHGAADAAHGADTHGDDGHGMTFSLVAGLNGWQTAFGPRQTAIAAVVVIGGNYLTRPAFRFIATAGLREFVRRKPRCLW